MESKGRLTDVSRDWSTGRFKVTFTLERDIQNDIESIGGCDLRIRAVRWREKRSLDANAYYWQLLTKVADATGRSNTALHNIMLSDFGQVEFIDGQAVSIIMLDSIEWQELTHLHLKPTTATRVLDNGKLYRVYYVMRGSHTYDTKEMSRLIDGLVNEAKQLGIETLTTAEIERLIKLHGKKIKNDEKRLN